MKIDRRSFLSFIIGGAAGTALSPLPLKLTDDLSIWSQNWPWTPVPAKGEVTTVRSTCTLCPGGCGISVRKVKNRVVKIEGIEGHPINNGSLCILGLSGAQLLYGPTRVLSPLKRIGNRGAGDWQQISWEQAVQEVSEKLFDLRSKHQPHTLACIADSERGTTARLLQRFVTVFGSPNFLVPPTVEDVYELVFRRMTGSEGSVGFDLENANFLLSFGSGVLEGWGSPVRVFQANSGRIRKGGRLVQVDTRLSHTAAKADRWVAIRPGTQVVLAMGLLNVILNEKLHDRAYVEYQFNDFQSLMDLAAPFTPEVVAQRTGVEKSEIVSLAREFARAGRPLAVCGRGKGHTAEATAEVLAVQLLNAVVGGFVRAGGVWPVPLPETATWPELAMDRQAEEGVTKPRVDGAGTNAYPFTLSLINRLPGQLLSDKTYPVQALLVAGGNPCYTQPEAQRFRQALEKIPFVVSFSSYMDETAAMSDYILPNHTYLERYDDVVAPAGFPAPYIGLVQPVVEPVGNTQHLGDVILQIAEALGGTVAESFPWDDFQGCIQETLADQWDALEEDGYWMDEGYSAEDPGSVDVPEITFEPVSPAGGEEEYPLLLVPYDTMSLSGSSIGSTPFMVKTVPDTVIDRGKLLVEVNPKTAGSLGLREGSSAVLQTPAGTARVQVHLFEGIQPGVIAMPRGLGHSGPDRFVGGKGVNYNELAAVVEDPVSGLDAAWGIRAKLARA